MPETHVHRLTNTMGLEPMGDPVMGRRILQYNNDVEIGHLHPGGRGGLLLPRRRGRRGRLRPRGRRRARDDLRLAAVPQARLRRDPARDDLPLPLRRPAALADLLHAGRDRDAQPLPQPLRPAARARAVLPPRLPPAGRRSRRAASAASSTSRCACAAATRTTSSTTTRSTSWAGTATSTRTRSTSTTSSRRPGRLHQPPPAHQTFQGPNFVICSFCPRMLDWDENAIALPYHHSNVQSEEMIYYVDGQFGSRKGVDIGAITLHPSGLPHGPQPGLVEKSLGVKRTEELAVMCDTFRPLKLTPLSRDLDDASLRALLVRGGRGDVAHHDPVTRRYAGLRYADLRDRSSIRSSSARSRSTRRSRTARPRSPSCGPTSATGRTSWSSRRGATASPRWCGARRRSSRRDRVLVASVDLMTAPTPAKLAEKLARAIHDDIASPLLRARERLRIFGDLKVTPTITVDPQTGGAVVLVLGHRAGRGHRRDDRAPARAAGRARRRPQAPGRARARRVPGGRRHRPAAAAADARGLPAAAGGRATSTSAPSATCCGGSSATRTSRSGAARSRWSSA